MKPWFLITLYLSVSVLLISSSTSPAPEREKHHVEVPIIKVLVRVFHKGKPVANLKKEEFTLSVNNISKKIHAFYQQQQKIIQHQNRKTIRMPDQLESRLFLLIFNICDAQLEVQKALDILFNRIIKKGDRIMVITNRDFMDDHTVYSRGAEKESIAEMLEREKQFIKKKTDAFKLRMKSILRRFKAGMKYEKFQQQKREDFILEYRQLVRRYKLLLLSMTESRYLELAEYLKNQEGEKWVLNFYQTGRFYKPKLNSGFHADLLGPNFMESNIRFLELQDIFETDGKISPKELSQLFAGTGATFHTLLMENRGSMQNLLSPDLSYSRVDSDAYNLLKKIAKRTGGTFLYSNDPGKFFKEATAYNDIRYVVGYHPGNDEIGKLKITHKNKKYRLVWD